MRKPARLIFAFVILLASLWPPLTYANHVTSLGQHPDWSALDVFQRTLTREEFLRRLDTLYAPRGAWTGCITVTPEAALIQTGTDGAPYRLLFAESTETAAPVPRRWRKPEELLAEAPAEQPFTGWHIALDPGHLGGSYGPQEGRSWRIDGGPLIQEGDLVLSVARVLKKKLQALGAQVSLVRDQPGPVTAETPESLRPRAEAWYADQNPQGPAPTPADLQHLSNILFYRVSEIRARAELVNEQLRPDLVICLHINAEEFPNPAQPTLLTPNHLHALVNGAYSAQELSYDDVRAEMLIKLLNDSGSVEAEVATAVAAELADATGLPPFRYTGSNAVPLVGEPYVWGRNLLANRLYSCPVVFLEPYVANSQAVYPRLKAEAEAPEPLPDGLVEEYAQGVVEGLLRLKAGRL